MRSSIYGIRTLSDVSSQKPCLASRKVAEVVIACGFLPPVFVGHKRCKHASILYRQISAKFLLQKLLLWFGRAALSAYFLAEPLGCFCRTMRGQKAMREGQRLLQLVGSSAEKTQLAERLLSSSLAGTSGKPALHHSDPFTSFRAVVRAYSSLVRRQAAQVAEQSPLVYQRPGSSEYKVCNKSSSAVSPSDLPPWVVSHPRA